jgi:hypothetical protein
MQQYLYNCILVLLLPLCFVSCSSNSLKKLGTEQYFQHKRVHLKHDIKQHVSYDQVGYVASKENHCFDSSDDREIYTVLDTNMNKAIQHFYYRTASFDVTKTTRSNGQVELHSQAASSTKVDVEIAYCTFDSETIFKNIEGYYVSVRLKR